MGRGEHRGGRGRAQRGGRAQSGEGTNTEKGGEHRRGRTQTQRREGVFANTEKGGEHKQRGEGSTNTHREGGGADSSPSREEFSLEKPKSNFSLGGLGVWGALGWTPSPNFRLVNINKERGAW